MIPTNLITGFLGVGKTTAIRHLLTHRPATQRWAVLVNEFGEIGVDGALLGDSGVAVAEVPGGCICCVSSQAFTVGLNRLIREQKPDRILIEPTGLGHPAQILATLDGPYYQNVLDVRATVTLLDARHLASPRHREHPTWQDQVHLADILIASKIDLYTDQDTRAFERFAAAQQPGKRKIARVSQGAIDYRWLDLPRQARQARFPEAHAFLTEQGHTHSHAKPSNTEDWLMLEGRGDGYHSVGWRVGSKTTFNKAALTTWLDSLSVDRIKGVVCTDSGWFSLNQDSDGGDWQPAEAQGDNRLELIDHTTLDATELDRAFHATKAVASPDC